MKIRKLLEIGLDKLKKVTDNSRREVELLILENTDLTKMDLILDLDKEISKDKYNEILEKINLREKGIPLQYIIGNQEFMGLPFKVNKNVLIPRQDTEILIEKVIELSSKKDDLKILEIGVGSGAISVSLAKFLKGSSILAVDISSYALEVAKKNAEINKVINQIEFLKSNLFENIEIGEKFDIVVSNPPYIPTKDIDDLQVEVKRHEPMLALDGGEDGLDFYKEITNNVNDYLKKDGLLVYEIGFDQGKDLKKIMSDKFYEIKIWKDLQGLDRVVSGYLK